MPTESIFTTVRITDPDKICDKRSPCHITEDTENGINKPNDEYVTYMTKSLCDKMSHTSHNMSHTELLFDKTYAAA